ncbi:NAD(P)/FAD-dependent oxidoreductase [Microlunatus soli]|uniref:Thioredoxin reductase n=1 Tax=Microlunatus soli TaxID=630515 RepID=A0A1H2AF24_9ACTN|nr:NAD(P)/FAD-dependent oxidoreductase [Microlunatus soli]SDT44352.1 Thioredoxin reductase [Microlunatus soli]
MRDNPTAQALYDVTVVGGGPAGLSAAIALGRSRRSVLVIDAGRPRNAPAAGAHNVLSRDGIPPRELLALGRTEAVGYGVEIVDGEVTTARQQDGVFEIATATGPSVRSRRVLLAGGLVDELPDIPGLAERWGTTVLHCPYCHGWEVRDQMIGILATTGMSAHQALLFRQLSDKITFFTHTAGDPEPEQAEQFRALGISVVAGVVDHLDGTGSMLDGVTLTDGRTIPVDALVVGPRFRARTELYEQLGGQPAEHPHGVLIPTDPGGRTDIGGVYAVGNASDLSASVAPAAGAGVLAGGMINADLIAEDTRRAVEAMREE